MNNLKNLLAFIESTLSKKAHHIQLQGNTTRLQYCDGFWYEGHRNQSGPAGYGKLYQHKCLVYDGEWMDGQLHGWGRLTLASFID